MWPQQSDCLLIVYGVFIQPSISPSHSESESECGAFWIQYRDIMQPHLVEAIKTSWLCLGKHRGLASNNKVPCITTSERMQHYVCDVTLPDFLLCCCKNLITDIKPRVVISYFHSRPTVVFLMKTACARSFWAIMKPPQCNLNCSHNLKVKTQAGNWSQSQIGSDPVQRLC